MDNHPPLDKKKTDDAIRLLQEITRELELYSELAPPIYEFFQKGLLAGLQGDASHLETIRRRFTENPEEKASLSDYLVKLVEHEFKADINKHIFIESGSTLALMSAKLAKLFRDSLHWPKVLSNNFLTLTALPIGKTRITPGYLGLGYLAFLDFEHFVRPERQKETREDFREITAEQKSADARAFRALDRMICTMDVIYMAASDFGFLIGPLVGSRANAIFKYCLINNTAGRRIRICLPHARLHIQDADECDLNVSTTCYTVMNVSTRYSHLGPTGEMLGDRRILARPQSEGAPPEIDPGDSPRSAPTELGLRERGETGYCEGHGLWGLYSAWLDAIKELPPNSIELFIGHNPYELDRQREELRQATSEANDYLNELKISRRYVLAERSKDQVSQIAIQ